MDSVCVCIALYIRIYIIWYIYTVYSRVCLMECVYHRHGMILRWHASLFSFGVGLHTSLMLRQKSCLMVECPRMEPNHWCLWPTYAWRNTPSMRRQLLAAGAARGFSWVAAVGGHFGNLLNTTSYSLTKFLYDMLHVCFSWCWSILESVNRSVMGTPLSSKDIIFEPVGSAFMNECRTVCNCMYDYMRVRYCTGPHRTGLYW